MTRSALVTGAGQNIGRAVAIALAEHGMNVIVNGLSNSAACEETAQAVRAAGAKAEVIMGDAGTEEGCEALVAGGIGAFGSIDAVVHNAAIRPSVPFLEMSAQEWDRVMDVNFSGSVWLARRCLPGMIEGGWGRIVLFAGMNAINGYNGRAPVSVSKHANWGFVKALAKEFGPKGVTSNIVSPGPIASDHADPAMTEHIKSQVGRIPMGRLGQPHEVAEVVRMLLSDAGAFVNGQMIQVNGGAQT